MKICSVCQRCYEDAAVDCEENHGSLNVARPGTRQVIANYRLELLLERDAAVETYRATRSDSDQPFIAKIFSPNSRSSAERSEKIQSETQAAANLNHLNIARVYDSGLTADGEFYTVTESISGQTLRERLRKVGAFPEAEAVMIARHAAEALEAAHRVGVVHRAVSPANIILARDNGKLAVKLQNFDFGAVEQEILVAGFSDAESPIERLRYLSPEQCAGQAGDAKSDVYSLAVVLYEMLCGRSPFGAPTAAAIAERRVNEQPLEQLGFDSRALLKHVLRQSLQQKPEARPVSAGNFASQLRHIEQLLTLPGAISREVPHHSTASEPAAEKTVLSPVSTPQPSETTAEKIQPRELPRREIALPIPATIPVAAMSSAGEIEQENAVGTRSLLTEIEAARIGKRAVDADFPAASPILIRKKETAAEPDEEANRESNDVSFAPESIFVRKKPASEPVADDERHLDAAAVETAPILVKRKEAAPVPISPEIIDLPAADVRESRESRENRENREERKIESAAPILVDSFDKNRRPPPSNKRSLYVGAGLLVLLASVLLGALLYNRQRQAAPPIVAQTSPVDAQPEAISGTTDSANSDRPVAENSAPSRIEKSSQAATGRENQSTQNIPIAENTVGRNESAGNRAARADSTNGTGAQTELNTSLADWVSATNSRNVDRQMNHYASKVNAYYRTRNASPEAVRAEKRRVFARADQVDIQTGKPEIVVGPGGKSATMTFRKKYAIKEGGRSRTGEVLQELRWVKSSDGWRIVSERDVKVIDR